MTQHFPELRVLAIFTTLLGLTACGNPVVASRQQLPIIYSPSYVPVLTKSAANARIDYADTLGNRYMISNNLWGMPSHGSDGVCEIFSQSGQMGTSFGWSWNSYHGIDVLMYPEVGCGWTPNGGAAWGSPTFLPMQISAISGKTITAKLSIVSQVDPNGIWDLAFDVWVTPNSGVTTPNNGFEIMIWLDRNRQIPSGSPMVDNYSYSGSGGTKQFQVWVTQPNEIRSDGSAWTCISYINADALTNPDPSLYIDPAFRISDFINDAVSKLGSYGLNPSCYICSVELGNEVIDGAGMTELRDFSLSLH